MGNPFFPSRFALRFFCLAVMLLLLLALCTTLAYAVGGEAAGAAGGPGVGPLSVPVPGEVWEPCAPEGISALNVCEIEAADQNVAYAIRDATTGKVLETTDYGDTWSTTDLAPGFGWTRQISVVNDQIVWVGSVHTPGLGTVVTTNGGGSWDYAGGPA